MQIQRAKQEDLMNEIENQGHPFKQFMAAVALAAIFTAFATIIA